MSLLCCKRSTGTVSNIGPNVTKPPKGIFFKGSLRWTSRKWKYVTHVQMAILIKMPKHIASSTVNEYKMDAFVHLRLFAFLAFSKALLNEVCRAHPDSLWCSWMSFFLSTCQIVFALSLSLSLLPYVRQRKTILETHLESCFLRPGFIPSAQEDACSEFRQINMK